MCAFGQRSYWHKRRKIALNVDSYLCAETDVCSASCSVQADPMALCDPTAGSENLQICELDSNDKLIDDLDDNLESSSFENFDYETLNATDTDSIASSSSLFNSLSDDDLPLVLAEWATTNNITLTALSGLLHILNRHHPILPLDARTLLQTNRNVEVKSLLQGGVYIHLGIRKHISEYFTAEPNDPCFSHDVLQVQINIDGLPISKSTSSQLWPILGILKGSLSEKPFTIGIYAGSNKPQNVDEFLAEFIEELKTLQTEG